MKNSILLRVFCFTALLSWGIDTSHAQEKDSKEERLDSIITYENKNERQKREFSYDSEGRLTQVLYYSREEGSWCPVNKREYFHDAKGKDTLCVIYQRHEGAWTTCERSCNLWNKKGRLLQNVTISFVDGKELDRVRHDYAYNEKGGLTDAITSFCEEGKWQISAKCQYLYDNDGKLLCILQEDEMEKPRSRISKTILHYDADGHLTLQVDSVYDGQGKREWRRKEWKYGNQNLCVMRETLSLIDHEEVSQIITTSFYDDSHNILVQRKERCVHRQVFQDGFVSFLYDMSSKNFSSSGVKGLVHEEELFIDENPQNKLLMKVELRNHSTEPTETIYYYTPTE